MDGAKPVSPDRSSITVDRELDWDIREERIAQIGQLVMIVRSKQMDAQETKSVEHVRAYHTALYSLYLDIAPYLEEYGNDKDENTDMMDRLDEIDAMLSEPDEVNVSRVLQELCDIDKTLNERRIDAGLDIPVSEHIEYGQGRGDNK